jgi:hypothetical protein
MKLTRKALLGCMALLLCTTFTRADEKNNAVPVIEVRDPTYDFGEVPEGEVIKHDYSVFNKGTAPLEIKRVKTD